jgi:hypothetical protein
VRLRLQRKVVQGQNKRGSPLVEGLFCASAHPAVCFAPLHTLLFVLRLGTPCCLFYASAHPAVCFAPRHTLLFVLRLGTPRCLFTRYKNSVLSVNTPRLFQRNRGYLIPCSGQVVRRNSLMPYEVLSKIFRNGAAIYTAVVVVRSTGKW